MFDLSTLFILNKNITALTKEEIAELLRTTPEALEAFEDSYYVHAIKSPANTGNLLDVSMKEIREQFGKQALETDTEENLLIDRIVKELLYHTGIMEYDGEHLSFKNYQSLKEEVFPFLTPESLSQIPEEKRPQVLGEYCVRDISENTSGILLYNYQNYLKETNEKKKRQWYHLFRQGLDILDLDAITYEILGMNQNSIGNWFPQLAEGVKKQKFFQMPKTTIIKVPLTLLQLSRLEYGTLNPTTLAILNKYCQIVFHLHPEKEYFVKTGIFSSKFDFRNAHVKGEKEVAELGEYLLYIQHQSCLMAGPLTQPVHYGVNTTNEWVVREYIKDMETNPCIYKGMPLHTEYRVFVDFDTKEVLGIAPYWEPSIMKQRFGHAEDADSPHNVHDYIIYQMHESVLMKRYQENQQMIMEKMAELLPDIPLMGQWSMDIMQNGDDFYIIDMALAVNSALNECIPKGKLKVVEEHWLPKITNK